MAEHDVMNLVEKNAADEVRLPHERLDVHVEIETPIVEGHRHAAYRGSATGVIFARIAA